LASKGSKFVFADANDKYYYLCIYGLGQMRWKMMVYSELVPATKQAWAILIIVKKTIYI
jgi:hypothetical protein